MSRWTQDQASGSAILPGKRLLLTNPRHVLLVQTTCKACANSGGSDMVDQHPRSSSHEGHIVVLLVVPHWCGFHPSDAHQRKHSFAGAEWVHPARRDH